MPRVPGELTEDCVEHAVLHRLYAAGGEVMNDGVSLPLEAVVRQGKWALYKHFKVNWLDRSISPLLASSALSIQARVGKAWASLRPSQPTMGPLRNAVLRLSEVRDDMAVAVVRELASLPHFRFADLIFVVEPENNCDRCKFFCRVILKFIIFINSLFSLFFKFIS